MMARFFLLPSSDGIARSRLRSARGASLADGFSLCSSRPWQDSSAALVKALCDGAFLGMWMEAALRVFFRRLLGGGFRRSTATPMDAEALRLATMVAFIDASIRRREREGVWAPRQPLQHRC